MFIKVGEDVINMEEVAKVRLTDKSSIPEGYVPTVTIYLTSNTYEGVIAPVDSPLGKAICWWFVEADISEYAENHYGQTLDIEKAYAERD